MTLDHLREIALIQISQTQRTNAMTRTALKKLAAARSWSLRFEDARGYVTAFDSRGWNMFSGPVKELEQILA